MIQLLMAQVMPQKGMVFRNEERNESSTLQSPGKKILKTFDYCIVLPVDVLGLEAHHNHHNPYAV